jgi:parallel beta-helix repeat protein
MLSHASHVSPSFSHAPVRASSASPRSRRRAGALLGAIVLVSFLASASARADSLPTTCDKVASPQGSDAGNGSPASPLRTAGALAGALSPGQVGCLHAGTYAGGLRVGHGGSAGAPIVLRSYPGERALITGRVYIPQGSNYVTIGALSLDGNYQSGERLPSPTVNANHVTFEADDVTNDHTEICFDLGSTTWGFADSTVIAGNRIHDCGVIPSTNQDHGIYVEDATNTQIVNNVIVKNADRGIQLYPNSTGAVITGNVIAGNGEGLIFSGEGGATSNGNLVEHNLIVNSVLRRDIESWYPNGTPHGVGNLAQNNCVSARGIDTSSGGFTSQGNVTATQSELVATGEGAYAPAKGSACANVLTVSGVEGAPSGGEPTPSGKGSGATPAHQLVGATSQSAGSTPAAPAGASSGAGKTAGGVSGRASHSTVAHKHHRRHGAKRKHARHRAKAHRHSASAPRHSH